MVTILLQKIIELLTGFFGDFIEWANTVGDKIASIKDNTDSLPDIETNTDTIANDTTAINNGVNTLNTRASQIYNRVNSIDQNTGYIKNYSQSIATSSGTTAAFAEDIANNTLDMDSRLVTIGSDTTQIRADSGNLAADVAEIKDTLGLYLYNTIVTEDAEGDIASCDTDLKDYLTEAKVTIPADAGGITGINVFQTVGVNQFDQVWEPGLIDATTGANTPSTSYSRTVNYIPVKEGQKYYFYPLNKTIYLRTYDINKTYIGFKQISANNVGARTQTIDSGVAYIRFCWDGQTYDNDISVNYPATVQTFKTYAIDPPTTPTAISFTSITDGAEIDLLTGIIKINTSPVTYDSITPIAIRTYKGVNNIYSDIGTTSVTYRETLKHYLKKQEA